MCTYLVLWGEISRKSGIEISSLMIEDLPKTVDVGNSQ